MKTTINIKKSRVLKPLAENFDDYNEILHECLEKESKRIGKKITGLTEDAARILESYSWPGNLKELKKTLSYAIYSSCNTKIEASDLPDYIKAASENVMLSLEKRIISLLINKKNTQALNYKMFHFSSNYVHVLN